LVLGNPFACKSRKINGLIFRNRSRLVRGMCH
jgi:hypothetical protein